MPKDRQGLVGVDSAGDKVLVHPIVITKQRAVADVEIAYLMINDRGSKIHPSMHKAESGLPKKVDRMSASEGRPR